MARIATDPNYTSPTFSRATATTDPFDMDDVQQLAAAMSTHDHSSGKGLPVAALADLSIDTADLKDGAVTSVKIADGTIAATDLAAGVAAANVGSLGGALAGSTLPNPAIQTSEATLSGDIALPTAAFQTVLNTPVMGTGSTWRINWKVTVAGVSTTGAIVAVIVLNPAGTLLDMASAVTYGNNYAGNPPEVTLDGVATYTSVSGTDQCRVQVYSSHAGAVAKVRGGAAASGSGTWTRSLRVG